ncbi:MAG: hypothetical protein GXY11_04410 [Clostridiales bacterium]|nr:hypothetical protein [Clostridiales bacterium]
MKKNIVVICAGVALALLTCLFFGGFGYWALPGLAVLSQGIAGLLIPVLKSKTARPKWGVRIFCIGVAGIVSFAPHVMLGIMQVVSVLAAVAGAVLFLTAGIGKNQNAGRSAAPKAE